MYFAAGDDNNWRGDTVEISKTPKQWKKKNNVKKFFQLLLKYLKQVIQ